MHRERERKKLGRFIREQHDVIISKFQEGAASS